MLPRLILLVNKKSPPTFLLPPFWNHHIRILPDFFIENSKLWIVKRLRMWFPRKFHYSTQWYWLMIWLKICYSRRWNSTTSNTMNFGNTSISELRHETPTKMEKSVPSRPQAKITFCLIQRILYFERSNVTILLVLFLLSTSRFFYRFLE